jgi:hypothetical protein
MPKWKSWLKKLIEESMKTQQSYRLLPKVLVSAFGASLIFAVQARPDWFRRFMLGDTRASRSLSK